ncbi:MAG: hypothetical protein A4E28_00279 [Methanocella sp. PtaU1.Bin125]|nr:MAG: hypothetical protein A4E28_00279 [Methanocella sp. PtaU1.Bin125]
MISETVRARGHRNVTATHRSTFEVTRDPEIGLVADCIVAVAADKSACTLSDSYKKAAASDDAQITAIIRCGVHTDIVTGRGSAQMTFTDDHSMVFRVSNYICGRTVMIYADKAARGLDRGLTAALASGKEAEIELRVEHAPRPGPSFDVIFEG